MEYPTGECRCCEKLADEITTLREKLRVAEEAIAFATKPLCMCFAGCPECDPTGIPTLKEALAKIREE